MKQYLDVLRQLTQSRFIIPSRGDLTQKLLPQGVHMVFDMADGFPMVTTKLVRFKSVWAELEWMLSGDSSINEIMIERYGVRFWRQWALNKETGEMGPLYGVQWRDWNCKKREAVLHRGAIEHNDEVSKRAFSLGDREACSYAEGRKNVFDAFRISCEERAVDQIAEAQRLLKENMYSRRIVISAWNAEYLKDMALPPCHFAHQYLHDGERLNLHMDIRSWDFFIGAPFNIAFYALMLHLMAHHCGYEPGLLVIHGHHVHLYDNHWEVAETQLQREPFPLPQLSIKCEPKDIWDYRLEDVELLGYKHHEELKAGVLV